MAHLQLLVNTLGPDWISLQFVPYGFHDKGLPWFFPERLARLRGTFRWHIMFHELWIGENLGAAIKQWVMGRLQKFLIARLLRRLNPPQCFTSTPIYLAMLEDIGTCPQKAEIYSNIPCVGIGSPQKILSLADIISQREHYIVGLLFGSINPGWDCRRLIGELIEYAKATDRTLVVIKAGRDEFSSEAWEKWTNDYLQGVSVICCGKVAVEEASCLMAWADFGFLTTPFELIGKSGVAAAFAAHGLPMLVNRNDWLTRFGQTQKFPEGVIDCLEGLPIDFKVRLGERRKIDMFPKTVEIYRNCFIET
jgi:hypothetical protein